MSNVRSERKREDSKMAACVLRTKGSSLQIYKGSGLIGGKLHDVIITEFVDKYFIVVSDNGKIGTLVQIFFEKNAMKNLTSLDSKVLFGKDEPEVHGVAQSIVEILNIKKPVIFGFSAKEYNTTTAMDLRQLISQILQDCNRNTEIEKLSNQNSIS